MIVKTENGYEDLQLGGCDNSTRDYQQKVLELCERLDEVESLLDAALQVLLKQNKKLRKLKAKLRG